MKAKAEYEALNAQLLDDLPKLFTLSIDILYNAIHLLLRLQYCFYAHAANQFSVGPLVCIACIYQNNNQKSFISSSVYYNNMTKCIQRNT